MKHRKDYGALEVTLEDYGVNNSFDMMYKKFKRKVTDSKVLLEVRKRQEYKKDSEIAHYADYRKNCRLKYGKRQRRVRIEE